MANTQVGSVSYDVKINTGDVRKQAAEVERIVQDMYKKLEAAGKKSKITPTTSRPSSSSSSSPTGANTSSAATQAIANTRASAQAQLDAISQYTPRIQAQFIAVERANARVTAATTASSNAVLKYGADSSQALGATDRLRNALLAQSQAQARLQVAQDSTSVSLGRIGTQADSTNESFSRLSRVGIGALVAASVAAVATVAANIGDAISRFDTLNNAPKVLQNLGNSAEESASALAYLDENIRGLPTSLDAAVSSLTRITAATGLGVESSSALAIAFNNIALAGGRGPVEAERALVQFTQALAKGKLPAQEFNTLLDVFPAQLAQISQTLLGAEANSYQLRDAINAGDISINDFVATMIRLNTEGGSNFASFSEQARSATAGVQTGITNARTAIVRGLEGIIDAIGGQNIQSAIESIGTTINNVSRIVANGARFIADNWQVIGPIVRTLGTLAVSLVGASLAIQLVSRVSAASAAVIGTVNLLFTAQRGAAVAAASGNAALATSMLAARAAAIRLIASLTIVGTIMAVIGFVAGEVLGNVSGDLDDTTQSGVNTADALEEIGNTNFGSATEDASKLSKELAKLDDQANKVREDFRYQLAELVASKEEQITQLRSQLADEEAAYNLSYAKRLNSFRTSQNNEQIEYGKRARAIQTQIDFLQRYNNNYNAQKLSQLQFALARENTEFEKQSQLRQNEYDLETQAAATEYEKRRQENQTKLNAELDLLRKHRDDVLSIRNVILLDEIEKLKQSRDEQLKSLAQQRQDTISNAASTGAAAGQSFGDAYKSKLISSTRLSDQEAKRVYGGGSTGAFIQEYDRGNGRIEKVIVPQFQTGGFTGRGPGTQFAGEVHSGEFVFRKDQVDQMTGLPKLSALADIAGITQAPTPSSGGQPQIQNNITISGVFATSAAEQRKIADVIAARLRESQKAKGYA